MTAISPKSKPDTHLLLDFNAAPAAPWTDFSQYRDSLVNQGTYYDKTASARSAIGTPREIAVVWDVQTGENGVLVQHGLGGVVGYQISITPAGVVECYEGASLRVSAAIPNLTASDRRILISWCKHIDGSSARSELFIYNTTSVGVAFASAVHAITTPSAAHTLAIGAAVGGGSAFTGLLDFTFVRIGQRFHSTTEQREDFVGLSGIPGLTQTRRSTPLVPQRSALDIATEGRFAGPAHLWSGHAFEQADRRLVGPLVNVRALDPLLWDHAYNLPNTAWWRVAPDDPDVRMCLTWLWYRPVSPKCNYAHVRLFVRQQNLSNTFTAQVRYRMYSMSGLPVVGEANGSFVSHRTAQGTCAIDHGSAVQAGEWINLGAVQLAVDDWGHTWLAIGVSMDEDSLEAPNTKVQIFAVTVDPYFDPTANDGLDPSEY